MLERRAYKRFPVSLEGQCRVSGAKSPFSPVGVNNICAKGISFISSIPLKEGQEVDLQLSYENKRSVNIKTSIVWTKMLTDCKQWMIGSKIVDEPSKNYEEFLRLYFAQILRLREDQRDSAEK